MADAPALVRLRVAFVTQRYGNEVNGGAESLCRVLAERMSRHWDVEVLTTCANDYVTWENHYPEGMEAINGVQVWRYPVAEPRDIVRFDRMSQSIRANTRASLAEQEAWMRAQGPWSPRLVEAIAAGADRYDLYFFFGYLYAQAYFGLPAVAHKAILAPLAHDEWTIHLDMWKAFFARPAAFLFNTVEEKAFFRRRFAGTSFRGPVVGVVVDRPAGIDPLRFRSRFGIAGQFLLYVGRVDPSKGCGEMFANFLRHVELTGDSRLLVTIGRAVMPIPDHPQVRALGFVSEDDKWDALAACDFLVMPSLYESLSLVLLEAWSVSKPVLVNGECEVLAGQARRANGGLAYFSVDEFSAAIQALSRGGAASVMGRQGHDYVLATYSWPAVEAAYLGMAAQLNSVTGEHAMQARPQRSD